MGALATQLNCGSLSRRAQCHHRGLSPAPVLFAYHPTTDPSMPFLWLPAPSSIHWLRLESDLCPGEVPWLTGEARRQALTALRGLNSY